MRSRFDFTQKDTPDLSQQRSLIIAVVRETEGLFLLVQHRPYSARNSPSPGQIADFTPIDAVTFQYFPDKVDREILSFILFHPLQILPDPVPIHILPPGLLTKLVQLQRLYFKPSVKGSWRKIRSITYDDFIPPHESGGWRLDGYTLEYNSCLKKQKVIGMNVSPVLSIAMSMDGRILGVPGLESNDNHDSIPLNIDEHSQYNHLMNVLRECAASDDSILWYFPFDVSSSAKALERLVQDGWMLRSNSRRPIRTSSSWSIRADEKKDWFEVKGSAEFYGVRLSLAELLAYLRKGSPLVALPSGEFAILPSSWVDTISPLESVAPSMKLHPSFLGLLSSGTITISSRTNSAEIVRQLLSAQADESSIEWEGYELRPYQRSAVHWAERARSFGLGVLIADEMGLGKTVVALAILSRAKGPHLVVCPASLITQWIWEARLAKSYTATKWEAGMLDIVPGHNSIMVTSYQMMLKHIDTLKTTTWDTVIFDEVQYMKNAASKTAKMARVLSYSQIIALTGTPIENHPYELWSHLNLIAPGWFHNRKVFHSACISAQAGGKALESVHLALAPFLLRRTRKEVLADLPPLTVQTLPCEMTVSQRRLYDQWLFAARKAFKERTERTRRKGAVLEAILRLRQICCDPALLGDAEYKPNVRISGKTDAILHALVQVSEYSKVIVFSQFASYLQILRHELSVSDVPTLLLIGETKNRGNLIKRFQDSHGPNIFLISLKAGGVGLNLMMANYVILCDPWWNPAVEMQAWSRAYRFGQTQPVTVLRFICANSIEEKIIEMQEEKASLNQLLPAELTRDDLGHLLDLS